MRECETSEGMRWKWEPGWLRIGLLGYIPHRSPVIYLPQRSWGGGGGDSRVTCPSLHLSVWIVESLVRLSICLCPDFVWTISSESLNLFVTKLAVIKTGLCRSIGDVLWTRKIQMFECFGSCRICGGNQPTTQSKEEVRPQCPDWERNSVQCPCTMCSSSKDQWM